MRMHRALLTSIALALGVATTAAAYADEHEHEETEQVVPLDNIPYPARDTIVKHAGDGRITKVEQETEKGTTVYEAHVTPPKGESYVVEVDSHGKLLRKGHEHE